MAEGCCRTDQEVRGNEWHAKRRTPTRLLAATHVHSRHPCPTPAGHHGQHRHSFLLLQPRRSQPPLTLAAPADDAVLDEAEVLDGHPVQDDAVGQPHAVANLAAGVARRRQPWAQADPAAVSTGRPRRSSRWRRDARAAAGRPMHSERAGIDQRAGPSEPHTRDSQLADGHIGADEAVLANLGGWVNDGIALHKSRRTQQG